MDPQLQARASGKLMQKLLLKHVGLMMLLIFASEPQQPRITGTQKRGCKLDGAFRVFACGPRPLLTESLLGFASANGWWHTSNFQNAIYDGSWRRHTLQGCKFCWEAHE